MTVLLLRLHQQHVVRRRAGRRRSVQVDGLARGQPGGRGRRKVEAGKVEAVKVHGRVAAARTRLAFIQGR